MNISKSAKIDGFVPEPTDCPIAQIGKSPKVPEIQCKSRLSRSFETILPRPGTTEDAKSKGIEAEATQNFAQIQCPLHLRVGMKPPLEYALFV